MDISTEIVTPALMAVFTLLLGWFGRGQFRSLKEEIAAVEGRLGARIDRVENRIDALHSDLTQVALGVGVRPHAENG